MEITQEVRQEISRLSKECLECEKKSNEADDALELYVRNYLTENNLWDSIEDINALIRLLRGGYIRFSLIVRLSELSGTGESKSDEK